MKTGNKDRRGLIRRFLRFRSTIYGRVVIIISVALMVVLILFNILFRSVYMEFFNQTITQNADNISSIIEGSLYYSMLENDKAMLQRSMDIISSMSGVDEVNLYDDRDNLAYGSVHPAENCHCDPNCKSCHEDMSSMFSREETSYVVLGDVPECGVHQHIPGIRHLLISKPILNEPSCYTADCHAHSREDALLGSLLITMPLDDLDSFSSESATDFMLLALLIIALLVTFLVIFTRNRIKKPLHSLIEASEAVSTGNNSIRIDINPRLLEDMKLVSLAFNNMLDNIEEASEELQNWSQQLEYKVQKKSEELSAAQNELIHVERIASLGKLSSSVAHEINNPLSGILVYSKLIHKQLSSESFYHPKKESILKNLKLIESETKRCGDIVRGLLDFSRKDQEDFEEVHLHALLDDTYRLMTHSIKIADITFTRDYAADNDLLTCSPNQIKQACVALLVNASEAISEHGEITLGTMNPGPGEICFYVADNGSGIAKADLSHIFEPFFSTKRNASGIGLGLSIVHGIIENHKGRIEVESEPQQGTKMIITLPAQGVQN